MTLRPLMAIIEQTELSSCKLAGMPLGERMIKSFVAEGITDIFVIGQNKGTLIVSANEKQTTVHLVMGREEIPTEGRSVIYMRDTVVLRDRLIKKLVIEKRKGRYLSPTGQCLWIIGAFDEIVQNKDHLGAILVHEDDFVLCDNSHAIAAAERQLFSWLYKSTDGIVTVKIDRPISRIFSRYLSRASLSPAVYTYVNGLQSLLMLWFFLRGGENALFLGCMMYQVVTIFDCVDGEIARAKFQQTETGANLDTAIDMISNLLFMAGLSFALWQVYGMDYVTLGGYVLFLAFTGIMMMTTLLHFGPKGGSFDVLALVIQEKLLASERLTSVFTAVNYVMKRDFFALLFAIMGMTGQAMLIPYSLLGGLIIWNLAILYNARSILHYRYN